MQNFGRGMWRRLNDYQTIQNMNQMSLKNTQIQEHLAYQEFQKKIKRQQEINAYRQKILLEKQLERREEELIPQEIESLGINSSPKSNIIFVENDIHLESVLKEEQDKIKIIDEEKVYNEIKDESKSKFVPKKLKKKNKKILN
jgi:hypothetical protein